MAKMKFRELYDWLPKSDIKARAGSNEGSYPFYTSSKERKLWIDNAQFSTRCLIFGTGGEASLHYEENKFSVSTDCVVAVSKQQIVNIKYTYYFLKGNMHILEKGFRGSGMKHISKSYIENIKIPFPSIEEQNRTVTILDKVQLLIDKRTESIALLDELLQSIYLSMFGLKNEDYHRWEYLEIENLCKNEQRSMRTGPFGSSLIHDTFKPNGDVAVLGIDNAVENIFRWGKKRFISLSQYEQFRNYTVKPRDVIITIMGTVGRSAVIPKDIGLAINTKHLAALTLNESKCNPYYLSYSIHANKYIQLQLQARSRGSVMDGLNLGIIRKLKLKQAPIELQREFEVQYLKIQLFKAKLLNFKQQLEDLLNSLSQRVFSEPSIIDINIQVDALIDAIDPKLTDSQNDIRTLTSDITYLQNLVDRINNQDFTDKEQYDKAKYVIFRLLKENDPVLSQNYLPEERIVKLELK